MSNSSYVNVEKLMGRDNYNDWKFAMKALLQLEDYWEAIISSTDDKKKDSKALAKIILHVDKVNYSHIKDSKTAKDAWEALERAFEDSGLTRKVGLLRKLCTTQLTDCQSIDEYCDVIISTAHKLNDIGFNVSDEWIGTLLLAGLPDEYKPMIMGIESSGTKVTGDSIKVKLLQDVNMSNMPKDETALFTRTNSKRFNKNKFQNNQLTNQSSVRCHYCHKVGHIINNCRLKKSYQPDQRMENNKFQYKNNKNRAFFACLASSVNNDQSWYLDSCASTHITKNRECLSNIKPSSVGIITANNEHVVAECKGETEISFLHSGNKLDKVKVSNVLYVPNATINLLSVAQIVQKGYKITFTNKGANITDNGEIIASAENVNGVYRMLSSRSTEIACAMSQSDFLWHRRLGHMSRKHMSMLPSLVNGLDKFNISKEPCTACVQGKQTRKKFKPSSTSSHGLLELIHTDVCGPMEHRSIGGARYFVTFLDDYSHMIYVYFLSNKSQVHETFKEFKLMVENQTGKKIKKIRSDNGTEYTNRSFENLLKVNGIIHQKSVRYSPQQCGISERANRTIVEKARSMLLDSGLSKAYWAEAVNTAVHIINRSPTSVLVNKTPFEVWTGSKPDLSYLRTFGCFAMAHVPKPLRLKWDSKSTKLIHVGYCDNTKGYRLINPITKKIVISRDVEFFENDFGGEQVNFKSNKSVLVQIQTSCDAGNRQEDIDGQTKEGVAETISRDNTSEIEDIPESDEIRTRSGRIVHPPAYLSDYELYAAYFSESGEDPKSFAEAVIQEEWKVAITNELSALEKLSTWSEVYLPKGKSAIDTRWVFKTKENGHRKARLVAKGFQVAEDPFKSMYAPVARMSTIRILFSHALQENFEIFQLDIPSAFINGIAESEIYIKPPKGVTVENGKVLKLNKALYGLKESPKWWNNKFNQVMIDLGFQRSKNDFCLYFKDGVWLLVFVDDLLITGKKSGIIETIKLLKMHFSAKELGEVKKFLGMEVKRTEDTLSISQSDFISKVIKEFGMENGRTAATPMEIGFQTDQTLKIIDVPYRRLIGSLMYLACTSRPDILFSVAYLSRFLDKPTVQVWQAAKRVLRYLNLTKEKKLLFTKGDKELIAFSDADWASNKIDRKSVSGFVVFYGGNPVSWLSRKQNCVAQSTAEAEYIAAGSCAQELVNIKGILKDFGLDLKATLSVDNQSAISMINSFENSKRAKHIDIKQHFIKDLVCKKIIDISYVSSQENVSDIFTKSLGKEKFCYLRDSLKIV